MYESAGVPFRVDAHTYVRWKRFLTTRDSNSALDYCGTISANQQRGRRTTDVKGVRSPAIAATRAEMVRVTMKTASVPNRRDRDVAALVSLHMRLGNIDPNGQIPP